ncbi:glycine cleavage system protein GcvH [Clostridium tepidum]|jgi:glycine cleavage system H protein|uniref:Glycine cleavage system H protein n=1 Tax=Clostridium tepidum TaxID=1962263 RepID=A0A1S9IHW3_9CLOT|nr:glycine cleavage system protein GcvH [Clostridium tepidum]MCR1935018.1 glycine cleavage system protein GcvH [Clostridium tepidum]MDU6877556.1 glycine cleavage system protein GcvH [Clostridium botulinum]OOO62072.1 glycine cleavage system protein H [Clostridium tepidum]OOO69921.1 glycine cleavage system protein H [Clostridium tepidum]
MKVLNNLLYTKDHEWIRVEDDKAYIGITDCAQRMLGDIVFVELPEVDDEIEKGGTFATIESVKAASDSYMPASGTVIEINEELEDDPAALNEDPYENWIIAIELKDKSELEELIKPEDYEKICAKLEEA